MKHLKTYIHPKISDKEINGNLNKQLSTRAIVLNGEKVLLLYTRRYDDYSLPGGKLNQNEDIIAGLKRELSEETGATNIHDINEFGMFEEYRPPYKSEYDAIHLISYCFTCKIDAQLGSTNFENYEINNGMEVHWVQLDKAINYNKMTLANSPNKGLSIEREIFLLELIKKEFY